MSNWKRCTYKAPDYFEIGVVKGCEMFKGMDLIPIKGEARVEIKGDDYEMYDTNVQLDYILFLECLVEWLATKPASEQNAITSDDHARFVSAIDDLIIDFVERDIEDNLGDLLCGAI